MRILRKLLALPAAERKLVFETLGALVLIPSALFFVGARRTRLFLNRVSSNKRPHETLHTVERIAWAIVAVSRRVRPRPGCLAQAVAAEAILRKNGHPASMRIGAAKDAGGTLRAHAWVECGGRPVVGKPREGLFYTPLPSF